MPELITCNNNYHSVRKENIGNSICIVLIFLFLIPSQIFCQEEKKIDIINSNTIEFDEEVSSNIRKLLGNVIFKHNEVIMHCDSAYYYYDKNSIDAFNNIHINQGDTLHLYGDKLYYDGTAKYAKVRNNVKLIDKQTVLTTQHLDYDVGNSIGYYLNGGEIVSEDDTLKSFQGYYYTKQNTYLFKDTVVIINPEYNIFSDTIRYNTVSKVAYFMGTTEIISDSNYIYCENGWYNMQQNISQFNKNAYLESKEYSLKGDSIYYNRNIGYGKAYFNVALTDTINDIIFTGNYATYSEITKEAFLSDSATMVQIYDTDSLYMHADTLVSTPDSLGNKIVNGYHQVKFYRADIQGKCDSISYVASDSTIQMFGNPVMWNENQQITGNNINFYLDSTGINYMDVLSNAFICMQNDSIRFDQISGRNLKGLFKNNRLYKILVNGNGQTVYFPQDNGEYIGINKADCSDMIIYTQNNKINRIVFVTMPNATLYPLKDISVKDTYLSSFVWLPEFRPQNKFDIYRWP